MAVAEEEGVEGVEETKEKAEEGWPPTSRLSLAQ